METLKGKITYSYDKFGDVLYSHVNKPRAEKTIEMDNGIHIHIDPHTNKVVGFTIQDYCKRYSRGMIKQVPYFEDYKLPNLAQC
jgi:uncharacterized protein YuzE